MDRIPHGPKRAVGLWCGCILFSSVMACPSPDLRVSVYIVHASERVQMLTVSRKADIS